MSGLLVLATGMMLLLLSGLAVVWGLLLALGVKLFDRETILTRWR